MALTAESGARTGPDLGWSLRRAVQTGADRVAVVAADTVMTYADVLRRAEALAAGLAALGARPGDRIGVLSANSVDYLVAYFAVPCGGYVLVPLNQRLADPELAAVIADCTPAVILADDGHLERAGSVAPAGAEVVGFDDAAGRSGPGGGLADRRGEDIAAIFYTGGSTGRAKGVVLSHGALAANAIHMVLGLGYGVHDTYLHCAPMFHLGDGMSVHALTWVGARHVIVDRFEAAAVLEAIEAERVTCVFLVPAMLTLLLEHLETSRPYDLASLRLVVHGGAPIAPALLERAMAQLGCSFTQSYGMTEAGPILSFLGEEERRLGSETLLSAGQPVPGVEVRIVGPDGTDCEIGEVGEIVARGPNLASGYWNQPELSRQRFGGGWYRSGDLARWDAQHHLYIVGRTGDVVISGGENVYTAEVEAALAAHPAVVEAAVIAVPSEQWGEQVHAAVVVRDGGSASPAALDEHCRGLIAGYKVPRSWEFHPQLPRNGAGKIDKLAIRRPHWADRDRQVS